MKLVIFGLTISSSWGNGHATVWRGLCKSLIRRGHRVVFFERDVPYYAAFRDLDSIPGGTLYLYPAWDDVVSIARNELEDADVAIVTSYCPDGVAAAEEIAQSRARIKTFYDLDTPVTLRRLNAGESVPYVPPNGLDGFDLVLSFTGGAALDELRKKLKARRVAPLYGSVDPDVHQRTETMPHYAADLSYLGTYAEDRQAALETLLLQSARRLPDKRFVIGGALYPEGFPWTPNLYFVRHLPPSEHPAFYSSSRMTLNITRAAMAAMGYCPSGRLFEAAACGTPILSDGWEGLEEFYEPGEEILRADTTEEAIAAISIGDAELKKISKAARDRTLEEHSAARRAQQLEAILNDACAAGTYRPVRPPVEV